MAICIDSSLVTVVLDQTVSSQPLAFLSMPRQGICDSHPQAEKPTSQQISLNMDDS